MDMHNDSSCGAKNFLLSVVLSSLRTKWLLEKCRVCVVAEKAGRKVHEEAGEEVDAHPRTNGPNASTKGTSARRRCEAIMLES
eukprot:6456785-Pyramimonas_sp.AAC.1